MRWTEGNPDLIVQWVRSCVGPGYIAAVWRGMDYEVRINTLEGPMKVSPGDWVIRGVKGEFYPCKPDVFDSTYEIVEANE
ncbi:hypothetical protein [Amycolatopsis sp. NPDC021455]|uniref:hypothetical protein n=1 Tax=Amycolatopsis sp. NPDC021455 TaxID=3154901 RepID=UPI0033FEEAD4